jgi:4-carboxymuconolactone decarboxylase
MIDRSTFIGVTAAALAAGNPTAAGAQTAGDVPGTDPLLPKDVYASSRNRAPLITRDMIGSDENKKAYDGIMNGSTIAGMQGPAGISLYSSKINRIAAQLNVALRLQNGLDPRLSELAMMVASREADSAFEWNAHESAGRKLGIDQGLIDVVRFRKPTTGLGEKEAAIINLGRETFGKHKVSPQTYAAAQRLFGTETLVNVCLLMGNYVMTAGLLHAFDLQLPPGVVSSLPGSN